MITLMHKDHLVKEIYYHKKGLNLISLKTIKK